MFLEKYESTGNDILLATIEHLQEQGLSIDFDSLSSLAERACDRHFGIGADHLILLDRPGNDRDTFDGFQSDPSAHCRMIFFNSDGSKAEMSGNGIRCFASFAKTKGYFSTNTNGSEFVTVETLAGTRTVTFREVDGKEIGDVNMGEVHYLPSEIPVETDNTEYVPGDLLGKSRRGFVSNSGIPHWTLLVDDKDELYSPNLEIEALQARYDERFPNQTNVDVVLLDSADHVYARFFERGAKETLSCGTGVTAVAANLRRAGITGDRLTVTIPGGQLTAFVDETENWILSGPVRKIARCEFFI